jgi:hypothetical protein
VKDDPYQLAGGLSLVVRTALSGSWVARLHQQHFEGFSISPDGTRAQVRMTEYWSSDYHSVDTRQCLSHLHERPPPQTVSLQLTGEDWKIFDVEFHTKDSAPLVRCH